MIVIRPIPQQMIKVSIHPDRLDVSVPGAQVPGVDRPIFASEVKFDNSDTSIQSTNVQGAIKEVATTVGSASPNLLLIYTIAKET